jgi:hypothetical protein
MNYPLAYRLAAVTATLMPDCMLRLPLPSHGGAENYHAKRNQRKTRRDMRRRYPHGW